MSDIQLRLRFPEGTQMLNIPGNTTFQQLLKQIHDITEIPPYNLSIKFGFPPKTLEISNSSNQISTQISTGETLILDGTKGPYQQPIPSQPETPQVPNSDGMIMIRRVIPADNSCLFNAVG